MFTYLGNKKRDYSLVYRLSEETNKFDNVSLSRINPPVAQPSDVTDIENSEEGKKGGKHAFHGWKMEPAGMSKYFGNKTGPHFGTEGPAVTSNEVEQAYKYITEHEPDELFVYSRGSAVWAKTQEVHPDVLDYVGKVNYLAPAKLRNSWKAADVELENKPGDVFAAAQDGKIPIKQAAEIAKDIGQSKIKIVDVQPHKSDMSNPKQFGTRGHQAVRYPNWHIQTAEVPVDQIDDRFPDWGDSDSASAEDLKKQMKAAKEVGGFDNLRGLEERAMRKVIRNMLLENASIASGNIIEFMKDRNLVVAMVWEQEGAYLLRKEGYSSDMERWDLDDWIHISDKLGAVEYQVVNDDTYEVKWSTVDHQFRNRGIGKILYNVVTAALTLYENKWVMCDRSEVSKSAQRIWHRMAFETDLYKIEQMDHPAPDPYEHGDEAISPTEDYFLTPEEDDDVSMWSHNEFYWNGEKTADDPRMYDYFGLEKDWWYFYDPGYKDQFLESGMTKRYKMKDPKSFLDVLEENGLIIWV